MADAITALRSACTADALSTVSLSPDGQSLTIGESNHDATALITIPIKDKDVTYSLASIYLMLANPTILAYRKACEAANVTDLVKVLDKSGINSYLFGTSDGDAEAAAEDKVEDMDVSDDEGARKHAKEKKRHDEKDRHRKHGGSKHKDKDYKSKSRVKHDEDDHKKKGAKPTPITNEQLVANLSTIVDKRDKSQLKPAEAADGERQETNEADSQQITTSSTPLPPETTQDEKERELLLSWLSPAGFDVTSPTVAAAIEADREATRRITSLEIPVGDSASILRAGAGGEVAEGTSANNSGGVKKRDFSRVLEIYQEVIQAEEKAKRTSFADGKRPAPPSPSPASKAVLLAGAASASAGTPAKKIEGNPIIIVPNAMTSCITLVNAAFFLGKEATFVPRDVAVKRPDAGKRGITLHITRKLPQRLGGGEITYDIIDNPTTRLKKEDWERVVAVIAQGASWQFKGWRYSDPVELFSRSFGFYVGYEGAAVPSELQGWNCKLGKVSRDRRGLDNICLASFWNGLEEFMAVHKQGLFRL